MKIVTYVLGALLVAAIAAAALFYFITFQPMATDYGHMKADKPALEKTKAELKKYKDKDAKEANETAWVNSAIDELTKGLSEEIQAGKAEVVATSRGVVVNIAESVLYTPKSSTFAQSSPPFRAKLAGLLGNKNLNGKEIIIANTTDAVPAQGKGKKKTPPRDAASIATDRSLALCKNLAQSKVDQEALIAAGYGAKMRDAGFKIKDHKTMIVIQNPPSPAAQKPAAPAKPAEKSEAAPGAAAKPAPPAPLPVQPKAQ